MTAPTRNARVTDRNERSEHLRNLADDEAEEEALANASAFIADLRRALATMTADRDRWRAQAEHSWPGKGSP